MIRGARTSLRPVCPDDLDLLAGWLADPDVYRYWGGKRVHRETIVDEFVNGPEHGAWVFIVEHDEQPIGWIQYWHLNDDPIQDSGGIDMVLLPSARGQGLGPDAARALVDYLIRERCWRCVTVDPDLSNAAAIRAWARAGFVADHEAPDHPDGPALIMVIDADSWLRSRA
jgi:aminoglycoside 6'-N-acetyltransferase